MQINCINISYSKILVILRAWNVAILSKILAVFDRSPPFFVKLS